jgi:hypothetical protein
LTTTKKKIDRAAKIASLGKSLEKGEAELRHIVYPPLLSWDVIQQGLSSDYVDHDHIVTPTIKILETWTSVWKPETYFAPYTSLHVDGGSHNDGKNSLAQGTCK